MKILAVCGTFDDGGGHASGYGHKLVRALYAELRALNQGPDIATHTINGGPTYALPSALTAIADGFDTVLWMPDVPNDVPKLVGRIKQRYPHVLLVTSKRNLDGDDYSIQDVVSRALAVKSNLVLVASGTRQKVRATLVDPLGVVYCDRASDVGDVARALGRRLTRLRQFTRVGSESIGPPIPMMADESAFFALIREQAERFHRIVHGVHHTRMLGNASFRCAKGFPSFRHGDGIFVSRRNIDKRFIGPEAFVAVCLLDDGRVGYYGSIKPSVDTPIQLAVYKARPELRYMLHSHTYIDGAPFTREPVPCGAVEEAQQILDVFPPTLRVNLLGHGSIAFGRTIDDLRDVPWIPRPIPEVL